MAVSRAEQNMAAKLVAGNEVVFVDSRRRAR
jgi:hypothetical protein